MHKAYTKSMMKKTPFQFLKAYKEIVDDFLICAERGELRVQKGWARLSVSVPAAQVRRERFADKCAALVSFDYEPEMLESLKSYIEDANLLYVFVRNHTLIVRPDRIEYEFDRGNVTVIKPKQAEEVIREGQWRDYRLFQ